MTSRKGLGTMAAILTAASAVAIIRDGLTAEGASIVCFVLWLTARPDRGSPRVAAWGVWHRCVDLHRRYPDEAAIIGLALGLAAAALAIAALM
jgi:hypothetical protein